MRASTVIKTLPLILWLALTACQSDDSPEWLSNAASKSTGGEGECTSFKRMNGKC